jgi:hypothetical protein
VIFQKINKMKNFLTERSLNVYIFFEIHFLQEISEVLIIRQEPGKIVV